VADLSSEQPTTTDKPAFPDFQSIVDALQIGRASCRERVS
jgi:hypothetical protein